MQALNRLPDRGAGRWPTSPDLRGLPTGEMPTEVAVHLARTYRDGIAELYERFGGYASFWLYCVERLIEALRRAT
ncbi:hypothetical protein AVDCRST_MAG82-926 [uncultured Rubrobacteraceae bacterium]|uniref:Uncharacterized protein n=1 Tax=uncultured Rubrobacteraceae bacterium TaxID=349277 RepID=A0A6J4PGW9_9ACTN|nr:hypothetical protein AVDCRST_MAG82-926 [uncultured Rubrobacteraceae bacterium]